MRYTVKNTSAIGFPVWVFVNGNKVERVISADINRGEVVYAPKPLRCRRGTDEIYTRMLRGKVKVTPRDTTGK